MVYLNNQRGRTPLRSAKLEVVCCFLLSVDVWNPCRRRALMYRRCRDPIRLSDISRTAQDFNPVTHLYPDGVCLMMMSRVQPPLYAWMCENCACFTYVSSRLSGPSPACLQVRVSSRSGSSLTSRHGVSVLLPLLLTSLFHIKNNIFRLLFCTFQAECLVISTYVVKYTRWSPNYGLVEHITHTGRFRCMLLGES